MLAAYLRANPNHYRALYNQGLVYEARAVQAPAGPVRSGHYRTAIDYMERALKVRSASEPDYTIYNTLGVMYLSIADVAGAERNFKIGLANENKLTPDSRAKLLGNMGYLAALRGDTVRAETYLARGAAGGSTAAATNLRRLKAAGVIKK